MSKTASLSMQAERRRENIAGYLFMAPSLLFFLGFVIFPMGMCLYTSFFNYTMSEFTFIGIQNYVRAFTDAIFVNEALVNTIVIVLVSVPVTCFFSLWVATIIYKMRDFGTSFYRCVFYLPVVTGSVAVTVVWKWIFNNYTGVLNYLMKNIGLFLQNAGIIEKTMGTVFSGTWNWLGSPETALGCIIMIMLTTSVGQPIVLYVSAMSNVDHSLIEAAEVDGATNMQVFWRIKWPQISPPPSTSSLSPPSIPSSASHSSSCSPPAAPSTRPRPSCITSITTPSSSRTTVTAARWAWCWRLSSPCSRPSSSDWPRAKTKRRRKRLWKTPSKPKPSPK